MMIERIGNWAWALTPAERLVSVEVTAAKHEGFAIEPGLGRRYEAMQVKQAKLLARGIAPGGKVGLRRASKASQAEPAMTEEAAQDAAPQDAAS